MYGPFSIIATVQYAAVSYKVCSINTRTEVIKCTLFGSYMSGSPSKYFPSQHIHLSQRCFYFLKQSWYASFVMDFSSFVAFVFISEIVSSLPPLRVLKDVRTRKSHNEQGHVSRGGGEKQ